MKSENFLTRNEVSMKKLYRILSYCIICSFFLTGCGNIKKNLPSPSTTQNATDQTETSPAPTPTTVSFSAANPYSDSERNYTILGLKEYSKIKTEKYFDKPKHGKKYLVLFLEIYNKSNEIEYFNPYELSAQIDGKKIENAFLLNDPEGYTTIFKNIESGKRSAGFIVWEVPKSWKNLQVIYTGLTGKTGVTLKLTFSKKDLKSPEQYSTVLYQ